MLGFCFTIQTRIDEDLVDLTGTSTRGHQCNAFGNCQ